MSKRRRRPASAEDEDAEARPAEAAEREIERDADAGTYRKGSIAPPGSAFARGWPDVPALTKLVEAFEAGNYRHVREAAPELARTTEDDDVRRAARELVKRTEPDPLTLRMLGAAALLLLFLAGWYWSHPHHP